jgi:hypothetical protein
MSRTEIEYNREKPFMPGNISHERVEIYKEPGIHLSLSGNLVMPGLSLANPAVKSFSKGRWC